MARPSSNQANKLNHSNKISITNNVKNTSQASPGHNSSYLSLYYWMAFLTGIISLGLIWQRFKNVTPMEDNNQSTVMSMTNTLSLPSYKITFPNLVPLAFSAFAYQRSDNFIGGAFALTSLLSLWRCVNAQIPPNISLPNLVMYLPFNGDYRDYSGNNNDGIGVNTLFYTGKVDQALLCNGNAYVIGTANKLPTGQRTIALWFNAFRIDIKPGLFGYGGGSCGPSWFQGINLIGTPAPGLDYNFYTLQAHCSQPYLKYYYGIAQATAEPIIGWHHWVTITNSTGTCHFIDGEMKACDSSIFFNNTVVANKNYVVCDIVSPTGLAPYTDNNVNFFLGLIDELLVYNKALTAAEIQWLYQSAIETFAPTTRPSTIFQSTSASTERLSVTTTTPLSTPSTTTINPPSNTEIRSTDSSSINNNVHSDLSGYVGTAAGALVAGALLTTLGFLAVNKCRKEKSHQAPVMKNMDERNQDDENITRGYVNSNQVAGISANHQYISPGLNPVQRYSNPPPAQTGDLYEGFQFVGQKELNQLNHQVDEHHAFKA